MTDKSQVRFVPTIPHKEWAVYGVERLADLRRGIDNVLRLWVLDPSERRFVTVAAYQTFAEARANAKADAQKLPPLPAGQEAA